MEHEWETSFCVSAVGTHTVRKIKRVKGGKGPRRLPAAVSLWKEDGINWNELGFKCVTLNNRGVVCVCVCLQEGRESVCSSDLCPSIHISEFCLPYTLSEIHRHIQMHPPPFPASFPAFLSAGLLGLSHFNLFAVIDLGPARSYVWKWDKASRIGINFSAPH